MGGKPLTVPQAWQAYRAFCRLPEVLLAGEPEDCETWLEHWAMGNRPAPRQWTDAYLAAFSRAAGMRFVSFDGSFAHFEGLALLHLEV